MNTAEVPATLLSLIEQIAPDVDAASLDPDVDLRRAADLDSLDFQSLVELVAKDIGVEITEADYPTVRSLRGLTDYVTARLPV